MPKPNPKPSPKPDPDTCADDGTVRHRAVRLFFRERLRGPVAGKGDGVLCQRRGRGFRSVLHPLPLDQAGDRQAERLPCIRSAIWMLVDASHETRFSRSLRFGCAHHHPSISRRCYFFSFIGIVYQVHQNRLSFGVRYPHLHFNTGITCGRWIECKHLHHCCEIVSTRFFLGR